MRYLISALLTLAWALWFGGVIGLFLFIIRLFQTFGHSPEFNRGGTNTFLMFERYQMIVGGLTLLTTFAWRAMNAGMIRTLLFFACILAGAAAACETLLVTPKIVDMVAKGLTDTPQFARLHGISSTIYMVHAAFLAIAGMLLPGALRTQEP